MLESIKECFKPAERNSHVLSNKLGGYIIKFFCGYKKFSCSNVFNEISKVLL